MKELKRVYGHFELLKKNADNNITKVTYSSLDKYNKSPYLQSTIIQHIQKSPSNPIENQLIAKKLHRIAESTRPLA